MQFSFATDVIAYLHDAGLPLKHFDVVGSWPQGLESVPDFTVGLSETAEYQDVARSLRLAGDAETSVRGWMARRLAGTNVRWVGRNRW
jgi:hypothetical protein